MEALCVYDNLLLKLNRSMSFNMSSLDLKINAEIGILNALSNNGLENTLNSLLTASQPNQTNHTTDNTKLTDV